MNELMRLGVLFQEPRFYACVDALAEHGIVKGRVEVRTHGGVRDDSLMWRGSFTNRRGPESDALSQKIKCAQQESTHHLLEMIRSRKTRGKSENRACAEVAAIAGWPANSFSAAIDHLRHLVRKSDPCCGILPLGTLRSENLANGRAPRNPATEEENRNKSGADLQ
jgi:hypothetical protein